MSRRHLATAAGFLVLLTLAGCATTSSTPVTTQSAAAPTVTPTPSATPTDDAPTKFVPEDYDCKSILPPATLAVFESKKSEGFVLQDDFTDRIRTIGDDLAKFADLGGILCQWAYPSGSQPVNYAYSPITADEASAKRADLAKDGYTETDNAEGTLVTNPDSSDIPDAYLFIDGYWFYGSTVDVLNVITDNLLLAQD